MYFGSIKFFKHLIAALLIVAIATPTALAINYNTKNKELARSLANAKKTIAQQETAKIGKTAHEDIEYQKAYPELYTGLKNIEYQENDQKIYLTFDDGPSNLTPQVLDILKTYGVKATFFVVYHDDEFSKQIYKRIVDEGHAIAIHTASHDYRKIYESVDSYLEDFNQMYSQIYQVTGAKPQLFRFPGGSINGYNQTIYQQLIAEMERRGFIYHDWNISSLDATGNHVDSSAIYSAVVNGVKTHSKSVILFHDSGAKKSTVAALPNILQELTAAGYHFDKLDPTVKPFIFGYQE